MIELSLCFLLCFAAFGQSPAGAPGPAAEGPLARADELRESGKFARALELYRAAAEKERSGAAAHTGIGICHYHMKDYDRAIREFKTAAEKEPGDSATYYNLGRCYVKKKQWDLAAVYYKKAVKDNPRNGRAQFDLANTYFVMKEFGKARRHYEKAAEVFGHETSQGRDALLNAIKVEMIIKKIGEKGPAAQ